MKKKLLSNELLIGMSAMIISLSTLIVFVYQTNLIRVQQYKSVYPHLQLIHLRSFSLDYKYALRNKGIGPAFITSIEVKDSLAQSYDSLVQYVRDNDSDDAVDWTYSDIGVGHLIQEKEEIILFKLSEYGETVNTVEGGTRLREILTSVDLRITYESIYGESWTLSTDSSIPVKN